jgi:GNAT superfamily N-acetyltransferase
VHDRRGRRINNRTTSFRPYSRADQEACLAIFDANCPTFFAPNERIDYKSFLDAAADGYEVCEVAGLVVAAFGLMRDGAEEPTLNWIMLDPRSQGVGIGSAIMERVMSMGRSSRASLINIAASHMSAPFFARFGAAVVAHTKDGWGPGMDRVDMELRL